MSECSYTFEYIDIENLKPTEYICPNKPEGEDKLCKFHNPEYLRNNKNEIIKLFRKQLNNAKSNNKSLECVGYYLPEIKLEDEEYKIPIYFVDAKFQENINFERHTFSNTFSVAHAVFQKGVSFRAVTFGGKSDFSQSKIYRKAIFQFANFKNLVKFSHARIISGSFRNVKFKEVHFDNVKFKGEEISFRSSHFLDKAYFQNIKVLTTSDFSECDFSSEVNFDGAIFAKPTNFTKVKFNETQTVFNGNISNVSFLETRISKVKFGNKISWEDVEKNKKINFKKFVDVFFKAVNHSNRNFKIFDERMLERKGKESKVLLESVKSIYRDFIENFDYQLRYDISGEFFVRQMELKRKYGTKEKKNQLISYKKNFFVKYLSPLWAYNIIAQYGQSYKRPIYWVIPLMIFSTLWFWKGDFSNLQYLQLDDFTHESFYDAIIRSISAFFPFYSFNEEDKFIDYLLRIILLPFSGAFFIALKRRLERKLRH